MVLTLSQEFFKDLKGKMLSELWAKCNDIDLDKILENHNKSQIFTNISVEAQLFNLDLNFTDYSLYDCSSAPDPEYILTLDTDT